MSLAPRLSRVLLAEDDLELRSIAAVVIAGCGVEVVTAVDGRDALKILEGRTIQVLVTDFQMPHLNGIELICEAYARKLGLMGVILVSGGQRADQQEAYDGFVRNFPHPVPFVSMDKPFNVDRLCKAIEAMLRGEIR